MISFYKASAILTLLSALMPLTSPAILIVRNFPVCIYSSDKEYVFCKAE